MLARMTARGADSSDRWTDGRPRTASLGVSRHGWELAAVEPRGVIHRGALAIIADATLYYRNDLRRLLGEQGTPVPSDGSSAELIVAAYEAFGDGCVHRLEGDFAFVIWDARRARLFAARDFTGRRTMFHAQAGDMLAIASTIGALAAVPGVSRKLSMTTLATAAAGLWQHSPETGYRAIAELGAGHTLTAPVDSPAVIRRYWTPPSHIARKREPIAEASLELRALLAKAVDERMSPDGPTAVSLSGGWDSSAVYGAGHLALERAARGSGTTARSLYPVSISYPEVDPGREDEIIDAITGRFNANSDWIHVNDVGVFPDAGIDAGGRDEPFAHAYEHWNRALSRGARRGGARVILDGTGGDQLFQVSDMFLAELFREGRWVELAHQWRAGGRSGALSFYKTAVRPALPAWVIDLIATARRTSKPSHYLERRPSFWFRMRFLEQHGVLEAERAARPPLTPSNMVLAESQAFLTFPFYTRIMRTLSGFALEEGVELRAPLLDDRVVKFAVARPWSDRVDGAETKLTLRGAMRGVLPDSVLAPRPHRTGVTSAYFLRQLRGPGRPHFEAMLNDSALASIGMIDISRMRLAWEHLLRHDDDELGGRLFFTLQADRWYRARAS